MKRDTGSRGRWREIQVVEEEMKRDTGLLLLTFRFRRSLKFAPVRTRSPTESRSVFPWRTPDPYSLGEHPIRIPLENTRSVFPWRTRNVKKKTLNQVHRHLQDQEENTGKLSEDGVEDPVGVMRRFSPLKAENQKLAEFGNNKTHGNSISQHIEHVFYTRDG
ncbi:hypothetical protein NHX12_020368 [Muraenolepis orangiensis]|uniref:Uncharacterized protein n=1 Tax=Muraenolepis orangiensis TaxID=630683 RepID=A0A9Q0EUQ9_9TELE|nr:hypothetical protein NHX12_020368 [Muraenolepis orangiensis]